MRKLLVTCLLLILGRVGFGQTEFRTKEELLLLLLDSAIKEFSWESTYPQLKKDCILFDSNVKEILNDKIANTSIKVKFGNFKIVRSKRYFLYVEPFLLDTDKGMIVKFTIWNKLGRNSYALSYNVIYVITHNKVRKNFLLSKLVVNHRP
jgi:hypothetical protein